MLDGPGLAAGVDLGAQAKRMRAHGVGAQRVAFYWSDIQPDGAAMFDFSAYDPIVLAAARHGLAVMPVILRTPSWAAAAPSQTASRPADPATFGRLLAALVDRYGPRGSLWSDNPASPRLPVRRWQVWQKPELARFWAQREGWATAYVELLRVAHRALRAADPGAVVVGAGVAGAEPLDRILRAGGGRWMDLVGLHPFARRVGGVVGIVERAREVLQRRGAPRKPLLLTEITWTSGKGYATRSTPWETSESGQAARIQEVLPALAGLRRRLGIAGVYWYTWASLPLGSPSPFDYGGLLRATSSGRFAAKPALGAWTSAVARLTG